MFYVIKAGGSGNLVETNDKHRIEWLNYRKFQINSDFFIKLVDSLCKSSKESKIAYINGGVGAYLFINLGKNLGLNEEQLDVIGCNIINITSSILLEALKKSSVKVYPELISPLQFDERIFDYYDIMVVKAITQFTSTDSLSSFIASKSKDSKQLFFKKGVPIYHTGFSEPTEKREFNILELEGISCGTNEIPGDNFILDKQSIDLIKKFKISTTIYNSDDIHKLPEILKNPSNNFRKTDIIV